MPPGVARHRGGFCAAPPWGGFELPTNRLRKRGAPPWRAPSRLVCCAAKRTPAFMCAARNSAHRCPLTGAPPWRGSRPALARPRPRRVGRGGGRRVPVRPSATPEAFSGCAEASKGGRVILPPFSLLTTAVDPPPFGAQPLRFQWFRSCAAMRRRPAKPLCFQGSQEQRCAAPSPHHANIYNPRLSATSPWRTPRFLVVSRCRSPQRPPEPPSLRGVTASLTP